MATWKHWLKLLNHSNIKKIGGQKITNRKFFVSYNSIVLLATYVFAIWNQILLYILDWMLNFIQLSKVDNVYSALKRGMENMSDCLAQWVTYWAKLAQPTNICMIACNYVNSVSFHYCTLNFFHSIPFHFMPYGERYTAIRIAKNNNIAFHTLLHRFYQLWKVIVSKHV